MPSIGTLRFALNDGFNSGVALRLLRPPEDETDEKYQNSHLLAAPSTPFVICRFNGPGNRAETLQQGTELLQQALDLHSMLGRADLHIKDAQDEHLAWWTAAGSQLLSVSSTVTLSATVGQPQIIVRDAQGNIVPPQPAPNPRHHVGFRFFRLSQISDDLYDSFRSMYLAFESLLSSRYPKGKEQEIQWLERALRAADSDLSLPTLCPSGTADCVAHVIFSVYTSARLPLFHAKNGKTYFAPGGSDTDRTTVQAGLSMLTELVIRMASAWFSARRRGGWVNLQLIDEGHRSLLAGCQVVYSDEPTDLKDETKVAPAVQTGVSFAAVVNEHFDGARRTNVTASLDVGTLSSRTRLHALYLVKDGSPLIGVTPDTVIDVEGFDQLHVCIFLRGRNANQPKYQFAR
jgi:hypothetical protein